MMTLNEAAFDKLLIRHKKMLSVIADDCKKAGGKLPDAEMMVMVGINRQARDLAIVNANFSCAKCKATENLTLHHLITRAMKSYLPYHQYLSQRHYWANQTILCVSCHTELHKEIDKLDILKLNNGTQPETISTKLIEKLKKKFLVGKKK